MNDGKAGPNSRGSHSDGRDSAYQMVSETSLKGGEMRRCLLGIVVLALSCLMALPALAGPREDAKALVEGAAAMVKEKGLEATVAAIRDKSGPFMKGELYIFVGKLDTPMLTVHPIKPALEGKDLTKMKDVKGKYFFVEFMNTAKTKGSGWVEYYWPKPGEKTASPKDTFIMRVPDNELWFACGYYK